MTFSIIIPVYNAEETISRCVDSIVCGGDSDVQVVLVEDCSTDNSWAVCQYLAQKYRNVICFHNAQNRGVSYTRNRGLLEAEGKYLLFVDSDDWVDPIYIQAFREAIAAGAEFAVCGYINHDEKYGHRTDAFLWPDIDEITEVPLIQCIEEMYDRRLLQQLWNKSFSAELVKTHGIRFDESISIGEDTRFVLDYIQQCGIKRITRINRPLYHYMRDQAGSLMFRVGYESIDELVRNMKKMYEIMGLQEGDLESRLSIAREKTIKSYAYIIMHNTGMSLREKRNLIRSLDVSRGSQLFWDNLGCSIKEHIYALLKK